MYLELSGEGTQEEPRLFCQDNAVAEVFLPLTIVDLDKLDIGHACIVEETFKRSS